MSKPQSKIPKSIEERINEGVKIAQAILTGAVDKVPPETQKIVAYLIVAVVMTGIKPGVFDGGWTGG